jgi:hypothetical protein
LERIRGRLEENLSSSYFLPSITSEVGPNLGVQEQREGRTDVICRDQERGCVQGREGPSLGPLREKEVGPFQPCHPQPTSSPKGKLQAAIVIIMHCTTIPVGRTHVVKEGHTGRGVGKNFGEEKAHSLAEISLKKGARFGHKFAL